MRHACRQGLFGARASAWIRLSRRGLPTLVLLIVLLLHVFQMPVGRIELYGGLPRVRVTASVLLRFADASESFVVLLARRICAQRV